MQLTIKKDRILLQLSKKLPNADRLKDDKFFSTSNFLLFPPEFWQRRQGQQQQEGSRPGSGERREVGSPSRSGRWTRPFPPAGRGSSHSLREEVDHLFLESLCYLTIIRRLWCWIVIGIHNGDILDKTVGVVDGGHVEDGHKGAQDEEDDQGRVELHDGLAVQSKHIQELGMDE